NGGSDNVITLAHQAKDARVIAFRAAAGENHLRRTAMHERRYRCPRLLHRRSCMLPVMVYGRGIPKPLQIERLHGLKYLRQNRRGGVVVEVNAAHGYILPLKPQRARSTTKPEIAQPSCSFVPFVVCLSVPLSLLNRKVGSDISAQ